MARLRKLTIDHITLSLAGVWSDESAFVGLISKLSAIVLRTIFVTIYWELK